MLLSESAQMWTWEVTLDRIPKFNPSALHDTCHVSMKSAEDLHIQYQGLLHRTNKLNITWATLYHPVVMIPGSCGFTLKDLLITYITKYTFWNLQINNQATVLSRVAIKHDVKCVLPFWLFNSKNGFTAHQPLCVSSSCQKETSGWQTHHELPQRNVKATLHFWVFNWRVPATPSPRLWCSVTGKQLQNTRKRNSRRLTG